MTRYVVGVDRLYEVEADSPDDAEAELAARINRDDIALNPDDCVTYEEVVE